jgi:hypothetical protein
VRASLTHLEASRADGWGEGRRWRAGHAWVSGTAALRAGRERVSTTPMKVLAKLRRALGRGG